MRTRANFGIVGPSQNVTVTSSGGIYSSDDQQLSIKQNNWPKILFVTWSTASGLISTINDAGRGLISATVTATGSMGGATMAYSISSGSLPSGMTINNSGVISGTPSAVGTDTTYTFTVRATATAGGYSATADQSFSITVLAPVISSFTYTGGDQT